MPTPKKIAAVQEFRERLENSQIAIMSQYVGIDVGQVTELRKQLREAGVVYKVYKNTLAKRALDEIEAGAAAEMMDGPTAWAFCEDPVLPAKILKNFAKTAKMVTMSGGVLNGKVIDAAQVAALADLPSRDQLIAQVVGTIAAPLRNLVGTLNAVPRNLVSVLDQIKEKKEKEEASAA